MQPRKYISTNALSLPEAREHLGVSQYLIERLVATGELPSVKIGHLRRVLRADLDSFIAARRKVAVQS